MKRDRETNRHIPEVFAYVNNFLHKKHIAEGDNFYKTYGIRRFGYWLEADKKHAHQELDELMMAGSSVKLIKAFNKTDVPTSLYVIFTTGGIDFVGGYTFYQFLKNSLVNGTGVAGKQLGQVEVSGKTGEEIHSMIFEENSLQKPGHWHQIMSYY